MDAEDRLRLDYDRTTELVQSLLDTRFKLLALVPTIAGTAVGLVGTPRPAVELLGIGVLGLVATVGILLYELRNSEILEAMLRHAKVLERVLGLEVGPRVRGPEGLLTLSTGTHGRFLGVLTVAHERALGLVYGAALGGWSYLVAWGTLAAFGVDGAQEGGAAIGAVGGLAVLWDIERLSRTPTSAEASMPPTLADRA
ncbi:MAG TPA: hypothetical protein VHW96_10215 [Solirubrobacteraceae bacterium]|jgi:hypothetical protein|nr:hypothetical protein [Solirubrobacteraceae bacterium]